MGNSHSSALAAANKRIAHLEEQLQLAARGKEADVFSIANQEERYSKAKATNNSRHLDIESVFDGANYKGARTLVTGGNRGLGFEIVQALLRLGATVYGTSRGEMSEESMKAIQAITDESGGKFISISGIDVQNEACMQGLVDKIDKPLDIVINNAGYFYGPVEKVLDGSLNFPEQLKQIDICALGPLRVSSALYQNGLVDKKKGKIAIITSQAGSITWRASQNPDGDNYGHHMSRSACNMMGLLLAYELKNEIPVALMHPGFNKTGMTAKYEHIWEVEGAVDPGIGALRVLHEINNLSLQTSGNFINCEDGLLIPW